MIGLQEGLMDDKETPKKTLRREIFEELNFKLKKVDYIGRSINNGKLSLWNKLYLLFNYLTGNI